MGLSGSPRKDKGLLGMLGGLAGRFLSGLMKGDLRKNPFFGPDGAPIVEPTVLSEQERNAAYSE